MFIHRSWWNVTNRDNAFFVDLYVRTDNQLAVSLYNKLNYSVYRHILEYYGSGLHGYGKLLISAIIGRYAKSHAT